MKTITVTGTTQIEQPPNPYFRYIICNSDSEFPAIFNRGYNTYSFEESININFKDIPKEIDKKGEKYVWFKSDLKVFTPSGKHVTMQRYFCEDTIGNLISESYIL